MWYLSDRKSEYTLTLHELEKLFNEDQEDIIRIQKTTKKHKDPLSRSMNIHQTMLSFIEDVYVDGNVTGYPHGTVITQGERRNFYRGEAENYPSSQTTLWREVAKCRNEDQRMVVRMTAEMRKVEFKNFLKRIKYVTWWDGHVGTPYFDAIAQHYGFMTEYLDITNDFNVAMFFACCAWDQDKKWWRPMTQAECQKKGKGVLYHAPAENIRFYLNYENCSPRVIPIGYQPFMRCQKQTGYMIKMEEGQDFKDDEMFERLYFEHSVNLSNGIFDYMSQGKDIYPHESLQMFDDYLNSMKMGTQFSTDVFEEALSQLSLMDRKEEMFLLLKNANFSLEGNDYSKIKVGETLHPVKIPQQMINRLNLKMELRTPEKDNNIELATR